MRPPARLLLIFIPLLFFALSSSMRIPQASLHENPFPVLAGLEEWVEFWKQVFTRYGASELIFHDPLDPARIYKVVEAPERGRVRRFIDEQRKKIVHEHGLESTSRVRAQRGVKERFASGLSYSRKYLEQMRQIFRDAGLPAELTYLPLVESAFNFRARSRAGALGLWQFMPATGRRYLRVGSLLDERKDPLESTRAAARLLKENYEIFGNWPLAITAYNHGREGMLRAVAEVGSRDLMEIIQRYQGRAFGFASKNFYAEFLAAMEIARRSEEFFPGMAYHPPFPIEEIEIDRPVSIAALLRPTDVSREQFLEWNPALSPKIRDIPSGYRVKFPAEKLELFLLAYHCIAGDAVPRPRVAAAKDGHMAWIHHEVAPGETLSKIAKIYQTSIGELQQVNELPDIHFIAAGQRLKIPKC